MYSRKNSHTFRVKDATGKDAFGKFRGCIGLGSPGWDTCSCCGVDIDHDEPYVVYCTGYPKLPGDIDITKGNLVLKKKNGILGINCGCYAKFHRQIAHIEDRMKK